MPPEQPTTNKAVLPGNAPSVGFCPFSDAIQQSSPIRRNIGCLRLVRGGREAEDMRE